MPPRSARTASGERLFAYGTLMRGYPLHHVLARGATFVAVARAAGRLLDLGRYPGLVPGPGSVRGEVYELHDAQLLAVVDRAEGYNFVRRRVLVTLPDGRRTRAWVYGYRGPRERAIAISHGDYRRVRPARP